MDWRNEKLNYELENDLGEDATIEDCIKQDKKFIVSKLDSYEQKLNAILDYLNNNKPDNKSCNWSENDMAVYRIIQDIENIIEEE